VAILASTILLHPAGEDGERDQPARAGRRCALLQPRPGPTAGGDRGEPPDVGRDTAGGHRLSEKHLRKTTIRSQDRAGFIVNALLPVVTACTQTRSPSAASLRTVEEKALHSPTFRPNSRNPSRAVYQSWIVLPVVLRVQYLSKATSGPLLTSVSMKSCTSFLFRSVVFTKALPITDPAELHTQAGYSSDGRPVQGLPPSSSRHDSMPTFRGGAEPPRNVAVARFVASFSVTLGSPAA
jgi:hypothetical protein